MTRQYPIKKEAVISSIEDLKKELMEGIVDFTSSAKNKFSLYDLFHVLSEEVNYDAMELDEWIENALIHDHWVFYDDYQDVFIPRDKFFKGKKFLIAPTPLELEHRIIIPGHRFVPFAQRYLPPSAYTVKTESGDPLPYKKVTFTMAQLQIYYSLYDYSRTVEYLIMEEEANAEVLLKPGLDPNAEVSLWVLDMDQLLENFPTSGVLEVTVESWRDGIYNLQPKPNHAMETSKTKRRNWIRNLEQAMLDYVLEELGPMTDITEQLAWAFFTGKKSLWKQPQIHIGGTLSELEDLVFTRVNGVPLFWYKDEPPEDVIFEQLHQDIPYRGTLESLDGILHDIGSTLREAELEAYMRDELFRGGESIQPVLERALSYRGPLEFITKVQEETFEELVDKLWTRVSENYNRFADQRGGKCRAECLSIMDRVIEWMSKLDDQGVSMDALPKKEFVAISSLITMITHTISALNLTPEDITKEEIMSLQGALGPLRNQSEQLMKSIDSKLAPRGKDQGKRPVFRVIPGGKSQDDDED